MSAPDLVIEYYRRDLDEAEEAALAALLQASPAEAERFAAIAQEQYRGFGLPEPSEEGGRRGLKLGGLLLVLGIGGAVAGGLAWLGHSSRPSALAVAEDAGSFDLAPERQAQAPAAAEAPKLWVSAQSPQGPYDVRVSGADAEALGVFNAQGRKVADLAGLGARHFRWDGQDGRDGLASAGAYQLRLKAGDQVLKQWVEIEVR